MKQSDLRLRNGDDYAGTSPNILLPDGSFAFLDGVVRWVGKSVDWHGEEMHCVITPDLRSAPNAKRAWPVIGHCPYCHDARYHNPKFPFVPIRMCDCSIRSVMNGELCVEWADPEVKARFRMRDYEMFGKGCFK